MKLIMPKVELNFILLIWIPNDTKVFNWFYFQHENPVNLEYLENDINIKLNVWKLKLLINNLMLLSSFCFML